MKISESWYNLSIAYQRLGRYEVALAAYEHGERLPDASSYVSDAAVSETTCLGANTT